jgi:hypothetical protein
VFRVLQHGGARDWIIMVGTQSLPEDGIVLPKHVGAIVKSKETYNLVHLLVCLYILWYDLHYLN